MVADPLIIADVQANAIEDSVKIIAIIFFIKRPFV